MSDPSKRQRVSAKKRSTKKRQANRKEWPAYLLVLIAAGAFGFLIVVGLGVQIVFKQVIRAPERSEMLEIDAGESIETQPRDDLRPSPLTDVVDVEFPEIPDDADYEILPPPAAKTKSRKIPGMMIVGDEPGMFAELHDAMESVIPGDVIEIRTNRILYLQPCHLGPKYDKETAAGPFTPFEIPVTIRAGQGFTPLIRNTTTRWNRVVDLVGSTLILDGLQFQASHIPGKHPSHVHWFAGEGNRMLVQNCLFQLGSVFVTDQNVARNEFPDENDSRRSSTICLDRCFLVAAHACTSHASVTDVAIARTGAICTSGKVFQFGRPNNRVVIVHSTFLHAEGVLLAGDLAPPSTADFVCRNNIFQNLWCCPTLIDPRITPSERPQTYEEAVELFHRRVQLTCEGNLLSFHGFNESFNDLGWSRIGVVSEPPIDLKAAGFPSIAEQLHTLELAPRVKTLQERGFDSYNNGGDIVRDGVFAGKVPFHPDDLRFRSSNPVVQQRLDRREVGCVPEWLPVPRPEVFQNYDPPSLTPDDE